MLSCAPVRRFRLFLFAFFLFAFYSSAWPQKTRVVTDTGEKKTARYFESIRTQPLLLHAFLQQMPKGADLHIHLSGAVYAESYVKWAAQDGLCIDRITLAFSDPPCDMKDKPPASSALLDAAFYERALDTLSMRQGSRNGESGHDHFFAVFSKVSAVADRHTPEMLAEARSRAAQGHLLYLELMFNPDRGAAASLGASLGWNDDLSKMRDQLLSGGLSQIISDAARSLDEAEKKENEEMHCDQPQPDPGCAVTVRYLYQVSRGLKKEMVFPQILAGFEMAAKDRRVVGLNLVMPEDNYLSIHDFNLHMQMLDFLHSIYPKVHITLHAGELTPQLVPPEELFHVRASIERGHAQRIGHGVDVMREHDPFELLKKMATEGILVEVCLTSNDVILEVRGARHPLPIYLKFGVPVTLATDDPGVARADITQEYERAAETYNLSYLELKKFARASLAYSFLAGEGLREADRNSVCGQENPLAGKVSAACARLLAASEKARMQWELEKAVAAFEGKF